MKLTLYSYFAPPVSSISDKCLSWMPALKTPQFFPGGHFPCSKLPIDGGPQWYHAPFTGEQISLFSLCIRLYSPTINGQVTYFVLVFISYYVKGVQLYYISMKIIKLELSFSFEDQDIQNSY